MKTVRMIILRKNAAGSATDTPSGWHSAISRLFSALPERPVPTGTANTFRVHLPLNYYKGIGSAACSPLNKTIFGVT